MQGISIRELKETALQEQRERQISLPRLQETPAFVCEIKSQFGDARQFLERFNPGRTTEYATRWERRCFIGNTPSLGKVSLTYGRSIALAWLTIQLQAIGEFCGVQGKQTYEQSQQTAETILGEWGALTVGEMCVFFHKMKSGFWGSFYGNVDGMRIGEMIHKFMAYRFSRKTEIEREEKKMLRDREERGRKTMTADEYAREENGGILISEMRR